jgi:hypothetical protein
MNAEQFQQLVQNRRARGARPLSETVGRSASLPLRGKIKQSPLAAVLRRAARDRRAYQSACRAWQRIAQPAWLAETEVDTIENGTVIITARHSTLYFELRRQGRKLEQQLVPLIPGARSVRFVIKRGA